MTMRGTSLLIAPARSLRTGMGCSPCEACRKLSSKSREREMRQLVSGAGTPVYRSSALTDTVTHRHSESFW